MNLHFSENLKPSDFIIHNNPPIWHYITYVVEKEQLNNYETRNQVQKLFLIQYFTFKFQYLNILREREQVWNYIEQYVTLLDWCECWRVYN